MTVIRTGAQMKNWIIAILAATLAVLVIDYVNAGSAMPLYEQTRLGMSSSEVLKILSRGHIYCDAPLLGGSGTAICAFSDPWHDYRLTFGDGGFLRRKGFGFRRPRGLIVRTLAGK